MLKKTTLVAVLISFFNLTGCSSIGNVVPKTGPTMEQVYDSMAHGDSGTKNTTANKANDNASLKIVRKTMSSAQPIKAYRDVTPDSVSQSVLGSEFVKLPNPELRVYIEPHFASGDQVPIPGYYTVFNVYEHDHYTLSQIK